MSVVAYAVAGAVGAVVDIGASRWAALLIVSAAFDDFRLNTLSVTNLFEAAFIGRVLTMLFLGQPVRRTKIAAPLFVLAIVAACSTVYSNSPAQSSPVLVSLLLLIGACLGVATVIDTWPKLERLIRAWLLLSLVVSLSVIAEDLAWLVFGYAPNMYQLVNLGINVVQASGVFSSNALAAYTIVPGVMLAAVLYGEAAGAGARRAVLATLGLGMVALVGTLARAVFVTLAALGLVLLFRTARNPRRPFWRAVAIGVIIAGVLAAPSAWRFVQGFNEKSLVARYGIARGALVLIADRPLVGAGPGSQVVPYYPLQGWGALSRESYAETDLGYETRETHNTPLQVLVDVGLAGFAAVVMVNVVLWRGRVVPPYVSARHRSICMCLLVAVALTEFFSLFDSVLYTKPLWLLFGTAAAAIRLCHAEAAQMRLAA
jgi:hypothetical protein